MLIIQERMFQTLLDTNFHTFLSKFKNWVWTIFHNHNFFQLVRFLPGPRAFESCKGTGWGQNSHTHVEKQRSPGWVLVP